MYFRLPVHFLLYAAWSIVSVKSETDWHFKGVNIAYGKLATQGPYTYHNGNKNYTADLAVDGDTSGDFWDNSCTHTVGPSSTNAYWTVDLQKAYKVTGIKIYTRDNTETNKEIRERLKNFIIYGNGTEEIHNSKDSDEYNEPIIYIKLAGKLSFSSITVQLPANVGYSAGGKYYLTLCEVEIYAGNPINGDYLKENAQNHLFNFTSPLPYGSAITVRCDQGYRSKNTVIRTCQNDGTWSGEALCVQESANQKTSTALVIGGISGAAMLVVIMISGLVVYLVRRRKRILKDREELMTYTDLRQSQIGPSSGDYAELNVRGLEDGISSKGEMPSGSEHAVYYNY